jgi:hypothetical protein
MSLLKQSVALDISKDQLDVGPADKRAFGSGFSVIDTTQKVKVKATRKFANTPTGFKEL